MTTDGVEVVITSFGSVTVAALLLVGTGLTLFVALLVTQRLVVEVGSTAIAALANEIIDRAATKIFCKVFILKGEGERE